MRGFLLSGPLCAFCCGPSKQGVGFLDLVQFRNRRRERRFYSVVAHYPCAADLTTVGPTQSTGLGGGVAGVAGGGRQSLRQNPWQQLQAPLLPCLVKSPALPAQMRHEERLWPCQVMGNVAPLVPFSTVVPQTILRGPRDKKEGPPVCTWQHSKPHLHWRGLFHL